MLISKCVSDYLFARSMEIEKEIRNKDFQNRPSTICITDLVCDHVLYNHNHNSIVLNDNICLPVLGLRRLHHLVLVISWRSLLLTIAFLDN